MAAPPPTIGSNKARRSCISIEQIDPLVDKAWDDRVATREDHSIFHRSAWARVLSETYGHQPYYLRVLVEGAEAALVPLMEVKSCLTGRRGVSLPFSDFAGPLWTQAKRSSPVYQALLDFASERKWKHLEIRGGSVSPAGAKPFVSYDSHRLDLRQGVESITSRLDPSVRRAIRKAERSGIQVTVHRTLLAMEDFYDLHGRTRRRHGLPPQPFSFFKAISRNLMDHGLGEIVLAKHEGIPVAGAVYLRSGRRVIYKFGASDSKYWPLRPNHLVMWNAIQHFASTGYSEINFGRTSRNDEGLLRFKRSWGCDSEALLYFRRSWHTNQWDSANQHVSARYPLIFGHLPIGLNRFAGHLIYPHLD
jgi:CelD/BcsL family acetyltransferase involved in cellulose biosynthesis